METNTIEFDRGVVKPSHPPIILSASLTATASVLKAGTVLKLSSGSYAAAANTDTPDAVLVRDVAAHADAAVSGLVLVHGIVAGSRLLNSSAAAPNDTLKGKLSARGIYIDQGGWNESNYQ